MTAIENKFLVGVSTAVSPRDRVTLGRRPPMYMHRLMALNLAAWIVGLCVVDDADAEEFDALVNKVRET